MKKKQASIDRMIGELEEGYFAKEVGRKIKGESDSVRKLRLDRAAKKDRAQRIGRLNLAAQETAQHLAKVAYDEFGPLLEFKNEWVEFLVYVGADRQGNLNAKAELKPGYLIGIHAR